MKSLRIYPLLVFLCVFTFACKQDVQKEYFVFLNTNPDREELPEAELAVLQEKHLGNMERLAVEGDLVGAGPFEGGGGMMILLAENESGAWDLVHTDPAVQAGRFNVEVLPVEFIKGGICQYHEPVEMATYAFYRFRRVKDPVGLSKKDRSSLLDQHIQKLEQLKDLPGVLVIARFDKTGKGFLMLKQELTEEWTQKIIDNQAVSDEYLEVDARNLWVARGTFCD